MAERRLNDWLDGYMQYVANSEPPELFKLWSGLSAIGACLQRKCYYHWDKEMYANLYVVLVGPAATRKGTALEPIKAMLSELKVPISANAGSLQALVRAFRNSLKSYNYQTLDNGKIITTMRNHSSLLLYSSELTVFLGYENNDLLTALCQWFDCESPWKYDIVSRDEEPIIGMFCSLLGATTPQMMQLSLPREVGSSGFVSRTIFVYGDRKSQTVALPQKTSNERQMFRNLLHDLEQILILQGEFKFTEDFLKEYIPWYNDLDTKPIFSRHPILESYSGRRQVHVMKLSMISSASRSSDMLIRGEDFRRALAILHKTEPYMPNCFASMGQNPFAEVSKRILNTIALGKENGVSIPQLLNEYRADVDHYTLEKILMTLEKMKAIDTELRSGVVWLHYSGKGMSNGAIY